MQQTYVIHLMREELMTVSAFVIVANHTMDVTTIQFSSQRNGLMIALNTERKKMKVEEIDMRNIGGETIYQRLLRELGREPTFCECLATLGAHPVGHSQVDPGRITRRLGADEGVREQT